MTGYDDGITNGGVWYVINNGRQDYTNFYRWGREVTIEISDTKLIPASQLPAHWNYNKKSFINYIESVLRGVNGLVTDTLGNPVRAKITVLNHDSDNSEVYSDSTGFYIRMLSPGTYSFKFEAPDYFTQTINNVVVSSYNSLTTLNVELVSSIIPVELVSFSSAVNGMDVLLNWKTATETNNMGFEIERKSLTPTPSQREWALGNFKWEEVGFINGSGTTTETQSYSFKDKNLSAGTYQYRLKQIDLDGTLEYSNTIEVEIKTLDEFKLEQNYPNPFNPVTTIKYTIPNVTLSLSSRAESREGTRVTLKVYDILGSEVATLVNKEQPAGNYEVKFSATSGATKFSSGIYFYKLSVTGEAGAFVQTKKMILLQ
jgi:hypothetical protein